MVLSANVFFALGVFYRALAQAFAFMVKRWYNRGTKGNEAMISVIGAYKKPGAATPGFLFWAHCDYKYLLSHLQI